MHEGRESKAALLRQQVQQHGLQQCGGIRLACPPPLREGGSSGRDYGGSSGAGRQQRQGQAEEAEGGREGD